MKKLSLILVLLGFCAICYSQDSITLKYDPISKTFDKTESLKFKSGKSYKVIITGINTSVIDSRISSQAYSLISTIPEILKPVLLGMTEEFTIDVQNVTKLSSSYGNSDSTLNELLKKAKTKYNQLSELKVNSDLLYEQTKSKADTNKAKEVLNRTKGIFKAKSIDELNQNVILNSKYIIVTCDILKKRMEEDPTDESINISNDLSIIADNIKSENYLHYANFIENAVKAKDFIVYNPLKAEKDLVDLKLTFTDSYKKDTIFNTTLPFYTSGNVSLDFSTGFFFNNLHENVYYLEKRDSLKNNVVEETISESDISVGALGHFSYKLSNFIKIGINAGIALSPIDTKTRYLFGVGTLLGRKNQIGINAGIAFARMKVLSSIVKSDESGRYVPSEITTIPTYEKMRIGVYIGVSYNLFPTKK